MSKLKKGSLDIEIACTLLETDLFFEKDYYLQHLNEITGDKCKELTIKGRSWLKNSQSIEDNLSSVLRRADYIPSGFIISAFTTAWEAVNWELIAEECRNCLVDDNYDI